MASDDHVEQPAESPEKLDEEPTKIEQPDVEDLPERPQRPEPPVEEPTKKPPQLPEEPQSPHHECSSEEDEQLPPAMSLMESIRMLNSRLDDLAIESRSELQKSDDHHEEHDKCIEDRIAALERKHGSDTSSQHDALGELEITLMKSIGCLREGLEKQISELQEMVGKLQDTQDHHCGKILRLTAVIG